MGYLWSHLICIRSPPTNYTYKVIIVQKNLKGSFWFFWQKIWPLLWAIYGLFKAIKQNIKFQLCTLKATRYWFRKCIKWALSSLRFYRGTFCWYHITSSSWALQYAWIYFFWAYAYLYDYPFTNSEIQFIMNFEGSYVSLAPVVAAQLEINESRWWFFIMGV